MRLFDDKTGRYTQEGCDFIRQEEAEVMTSYRALVEKGVHPRDAYVALIGALFEEMCSAVIDADKRNSPPV